MSTATETILSNIKKNPEEIQENIMIPEEILALETNTKEHFIPRLRYFSVGPDNKHIKCPLCEVRDVTYKVSPMNSKDKINACLSCFSCCFPILFIPFILLIISGCTRRRRQFCSNCGAQLGYHFRPS